MAMVVVTRKEALQQSSRQPIRKQRMMLPIRQNIHWNAVYIFSISGANSKAPQD